MQCPFCQTENREDRETCYVCGKDISTIRLLVNKARQHYNDALEHAERDRIPEAIDELRKAIELDTSLANAHVVLGTLYAREGKFPEARECWQNALALNPEMSRAHDYLERVESVQAALPTLKAYRRVAMLLLTVAVALAAYLIFRFRPDPGAAALKFANEHLDNGQYARAKEELEQASILAEPDSPVKVAADALAHTLQLDLQQRLRLIQDLKFRQLYPEALEAMAELEAIAPDDKTSAALSTIREDISYYYRNMLSQLYMAYEKGDVDYPTLQTEVGRFLSLYPPSPEYDEIRSYLDRAQTLEVQAAMDELRRRFAMDTNLQAVVEGLRELAPRFEENPTFQSARSTFVEDILKSEINMFIGYLDQDDFSRATALLTDIDNYSAELQEMVLLDIDGAVEMALDLLKDARRQYQFKQVEDLIKLDQMEAAEEALWQALQEPDLTAVEKGVLRNYWRQMNSRDPLKKLINSIETETRFYSLSMSEKEASETLQLYDDVQGRSLNRRQQVQLTGLAAASALKLGMTDQATSMVATLKKIDKNSTVTVAVDKLVTAKPAVKPIVKPVGKGKPRPSPAESPEE